MTTPASADHRAGAITLWRAKRFRSPSRNSLPCREYLRLPTWKPDRSPPRENGEGKGTGPLPPAATAPDGVASRAWQQRSPATRRSGSRLRGTSTPPCRGRRSRRVFRSHRTALDRDAAGRRRPYLVVATRRPSGEGEVPLRVDPAGTARARLWKQPVGRKWGTRGTDRRAGKRGYSTRALTRPGREQAGKPSLGTINSRCC